MASNRPSSRRRARVLCALASAVFSLALIAGPPAAGGDRKGAEPPAVFTGQAYCPERRADIAFDYFSAYCAESRAPVKVRWETRWEIDIVGFHVWRSDFEDGVYKRRSLDLIHAAGTPYSGAGYLFEDREALGCYPYYYILEIFSFDGGSCFLEPVRTYEDHRRCEDDDYVHATCFVSALAR